MKSIDPIFDEVRLRVPAATDVVVESVTRRALSRFFRLSMCWAEESTSTEIQPDKKAYEASDLFDGLVHRVDGVWIVEDGRQLRAIARQTSRPSGGAPDAYWLADTPSLIHLASDPLDLAGKHLGVRAILIPAPDATEVPGWVLDRHLDSIVDGVAGELMLMPGVPWSNHDRGRELEQELLTAAAEARTSARKGFIRGAQVARFTSFDEL